MDDRLFSIEELSGYLNIPKSTIYKLSQSKEIPSVKIGKQLRFRKSSIDAWLSQNENLSNKSSATSCSAGRNILLVDDDGLVLRSVSRFLKMHGYNVEQASSGEDALNKIENMDFKAGLVITDVKMPGIDGIETIKRIRELNRAQNRVSPKEIIITGYADSQIEQEAIDLGIKDFIYKPFATTEFIETVEKGLN